MNRKRILTSAVGALVAAAIAGGVAYATIPGPDKVYSACMLKALGTIRLIDKSLPSTNLMSHCTDKETEISWNQAGQPGPQGAKGEPGAPGAPGTNGTNGADGADGEDGLSVASAVEPAGGNCANGGSKFTAANGVTYACNGAPGPSGPGRAPIIAVQIPVGTTMVLYDLPGIGRFSAQCRVGIHYNADGVYETVPGWEYSNTSGEERTFFAQALDAGRVGPRARPVAPGGVVNGGGQGFLDQIQVWTATSPAEVSIAAIDADGFGVPCTYWATATTP